MSCHVPTLRLKKRRQLKQGQSERAVGKDNQSDSDLKGSVICEPNPTTQIEEKYRESDKSSKTERNLSGESGKTHFTVAVITAVGKYYST